MDWAVIAIFGGLIAVDGLIHVVAAMVILPIFEREIPFGVQPAPPDSDAELISFPTSHGLTLRGSLHRRSHDELRGLILFCPELGGNHWSAMKYAAALRDAGFAVLSFDFRNQGDSDHLPKYAPLHWLTEYEVHDVLAAIRYARSRPDLKDLPLGLFGISRGGGAALAAAARRGEVQCVACEGVASAESLMLHYTLRWASLYAPEWVMRVFPVWHVRMTLQVTRWISQIRRRCRYTTLERRLSRLRRTPVFMITGGADTYVPPEIPQSLCQKIGPSCRGVWVVRRAKHNAAREVSADEYDARLLQFFSCLSQPGRTPDQTRSGQLQL